MHQDDEARAKKDLEKVQSQVDQLENLDRVRLGIIRNQAFGQTSYVNVEYRVNTSSYLDPADPFFGLQLIEDFDGIDLAHLEVTTRNLPQNEWLIATHHESDWNFYEHHVFYSVPIPLRWGSADVKTVINEFEKTIESNILPDAENQKLRTAIARLQAIETR